MARRLPPLYALRAFEASARHGSFVAAASELRVSAAAVSQQVRRLEHYLDTALFQRLARGLTLTDQGRDYLPELSAGFDLLSESTARVRTKRADGVLTLTTLAAFANGWLLPRMHRFRERAPRVDVVMRTSRQVLDFRRDAIDLAIRFAPALLQEFSQRIAANETFTIESLEADLHGFVTEKNIPQGDMIHALRLSTTGTAVGPGVYDCLVLLGKEKSLARIAQAINKAVG